MAVNFIVQSIDKYCMICYNNFGDGTHNKKQHFIGFAPRGGHP